LEAFKLDAELPRSASEGQAAKDEGPLPVVQLKNWGFSNQPFMVNPVFFDGLSQNAVNCCGFLGF
jgi:hypothetical protein